jgi:hypothetical protein
MLPKPNAAMPGQSEWTDIPLKPIPQTDHGTFNRVPPANEIFVRLQKYEDRMNDMINRPARAPRLTHFPEELPPRPSPNARAIRSSKVALFLFSFFLFAGLATTAVVLGIILEGDQS